MKKLIDILDKADAIVSTLFVILIFGDVMLQVFTRVTPNSISVQWTVEMGSMLLCALIWVGLGMGIKNDSHTRFTLVIDKMSDRARRISLMFADFAFLVFNAVLAYQTLNMLKFYVERGNKTTILQWSRAVTMSPMLIGLVFAVIRLLYCIVHSIQHFNDPMERALTKELEGAEEFAEEVLEDEASVKDGEVNE